VIAHGGVISVDDAPEGGAIFTMQFETIPAGTLETPLPFREQPARPESLLRL
jgi:hypothetical protein